ncbi:MAG: 16S rRNA (cytosine(1402)-N(4))-methyltransferase RsmH [SAR324 cluster bacterium]|nr:16S rRNA (cytosine(1402)-N(4))-methyltransferase RsmH [SAR324 cluster bacterium]
MNPKKIKYEKNELLHVPVLEEEILKYAPPFTEKILDCTLGGGGHSHALLTRFDQARLLATDRDPFALESAQMKLGKFLPRLDLQHARFSSLKEILSSKQWRFDYIIADIGVSSFQLDQSERGFSFTQDGPLDMRMDPNSNGSTAQDWVNNANPAELTEIFRKYGEERFAPKIAHEIVKKRKILKFHSTVQFANFVASLIPRKFQKKGFHPATLVFQALRIAVNDELLELKALLNTTVDYLKNEGRLALISFHSLEDRMIKHKFQEWENPCTCPPNFPLCICGLTPIGKRVFTRPISPSLEEIKKNPRSRSAKLRIFQRI